MITVKASAVVVSAVLLLSGCVPQTDSASTVDGSNCTVTYLQVIQINDLMKGAGVDGDLSNGELNKIMSEGEELDDFADKLLKPGREVDDAILGFIAEEHDLIEYIHDAHVGTVNPQNRSARTAATDGITEAGDALRSVCDPLVKEDAAAAFN